MKCPDCMGTGQQLIGPTEPRECPTCSGSGGVPPCCVCGRPAVTEYPGECGEPSCGAAACELRIQYALDYHDEAGNR